MADATRVALVAFALAVGTALVWGGATSATAFGAYNPAWDGGSDLREQADAAGADPQPVRDVRAYDDADPEGTVALVLSPDAPYIDSEAARIGRFVRDGGTLVVAGSFDPHANDLLAAVGADARIDGRQLRDERHHYRSPALPVATNVSDHRLVADVERVTLNHGSVVRPNGATVLVSSSEFGYLDENGNERLDRQERIASYPVATVESVGDGQVIVVSDPSVFVNAMLERPGNRAFARALFADHRIALFDYSKIGGFPPLATAVLTFRGSALLQLVVGIVLVGAVAAWGRRVLPGRLRDVGRIASDGRDPVGRDARIEAVAADRSDVDRESLERLVSGGVGGSGSDDRTRAE